jgi:hypothetical protein
MEPEEIESAYEGLTTLLRSATEFSVLDGWSAEMIGAHVAINNDEIAAVAEAVARGETTHYDNADGVDDANLRDFASRVGGRAGVAAEIERSARRLAEAKRMLGPVAEHTEIPVLIHDNGNVVVDRPLAIGDFIEGNATFHLDMHHEQVRALVRDE